MCFGNEDYVGKAPDVHKCHSYTYRNVYQGAGQWFSFYENGYECKNIHKIYQGINSNRENLPATRFQIDNDHRQSAYYKPRGYEATLPNKGPNLFVAIWTTQIGNRPLFCIFR
jgi:hypothetical protein